MLLATGVWLVLPFWQLSSQFATHTARQPSRLYGASAVLRHGEVSSPRQLAETLRALGYREVDSKHPEVGEFHREGERLVVHRRAFPTPGGLAPSGLLGVGFAGREIAVLRRGSDRVDRALLEPPLVTSYYGPEVQDRWPVALDGVPEHVVRAVLAAEDAGFYRHPGLSPSGIVRAALKNLVGGEVRQGGSTLTQQLVKNLYLTRERTVVRKVREAALAVLVDWRYGKDAILQAYLNEVYWGARNGINLMGIGAASRAYFGCPPEELNLSQAATLAGMIQAPGDYLPQVHPERAQARRDWVLDRMVEEEWLTAEEAERVRQQPVVAAKRSLLVRRARYFSDAMRREARRRYGVEDLAEGGHALLSTLEPEEQEAAEAAVAWGLEALESGWEKGRQADQPLQAALISADPRSGEIVAYVGGRDYERSQYDRAGLARRQAGSAFKPVVYLTAFEAGSVHAATLLDDAPLTVTLAGQSWSPDNADNRFRGWVTVRTALEQSLNVPTARLALQTGLRRVLDTARALGIEGPLQPVPALALGAFEVTPLEMTTLYGTLAAGGVRPSLHGLRGVLDRTGRRISGSELPRRQRVASVRSVYLVTSLLQGVLDRGTGASARTAGLRGPLAGKTGTSNERRDSWFAGYSPTRVAVTWVGYDDNAPTRLSGARAALPIWARFMYSTRPSDGWSAFETPDGIVTALVDPLTGELATTECPEVLNEVFVRGRVPRTVCHLHGGWFAEPLTPRSTIEEERPGHPFRRWLDRVFGAGQGVGEGETY